MCAKLRSCRAETNRLGEFPFRREYPLSLADELCMDPTEETLNTRPSALLEWVPKYSVHVPEIDQQHQVWFALVNRVYQAVLYGCGKEILRPVLAETTQYTFFHFDHEEKLMAEFDYPEREEHIREHRDLARRAREFSERVENGECATMLEYLVFLSDWIKEHTTTTDRRLGDYLQSHPLDYSSGFARNN